MIEKSIPLNLLRVCLLAVKTKIASIYYNEA
jgi:hypothetical protein